MLPLLLISVATLQISCGNNHETIHPEYRVLTEAVYASGNLYPANEYKVSANADGFLTQRLVNAGDRVFKDQLLFAIENDMQQIKANSSALIYKQALDNYHDGSPALAELKLAINSAGEKLKNDSINFSRYQNLFRQNAVSKVEFDKAKLTFTISGNELKQRKDSYQKLKNQLFVELQQAESNYRVNFKDANNYLVKSRINAMVFDVYKEPGEAIRRNEPIALLGDAEKSYLKLQVDELDIPRILVGQKVLVKLDIDKNKIYEARVSKVYPKLNVEDQSFRVDAEFIGASPKNLYGLTVEANIILHDRVKRLTIPKTALAGTDSVWTKIDGEEKKVVIKTGIENFEFVEIKGGITTSSEIIVK